MHIMDRIKLRKFERIIAAINYFISTLAIGFAVMLLIAFISKKPFHWLLFNICAIVVIAVALRNVIHFYKWYIKSHPIHLQCPKCQTMIPLKRCKEHEVLSSPVIIYLETFRFQLIRLKNYFYWISYRPYLQLDCPTCGEKQVICPYCHEPIPKEKITFSYNKTSRCPHCEKKIYTTLPLQESDDLIEISTIAK